MQLLKDEREFLLANSSFTSDLAVFQELEDIASTPGSKTFHRDVFLQFLRSHGWKVETLAEIADETDNVNEEEAVAQTVERPLSHIVFPSSSDSRSYVTTAVKAGGPAEDCLSNVEPDDEDEEEDKEEEPEMKRSTYVGRGNVQAVCSARKAAGLNEAFPRSDPLLVEFALQLSGAAAKDIANKVIYVLRELCFRSTLLIVTAAFVWSFLNTINSVDLRQKLIFHN